MTFNFKKIFLSIFLLVVTQVVVLAQGSDPVPPGAEIPLDGGIIGLLVAGAIYGTKKIYDSHKRGHK